MDHNNWASCAARTVLPLVALTACGGCWNATPAADAESQTAAKRRAPLDERRENYAKGKALARVWLDGLEIDVFDLNSRQMAGIKKLGEIAAAYHFLWQHARDDEERAAILRRVETLVAQTDSEAYHGILRGAGLL